METSLSIPPEVLELFSEKYPLLALQMSHWEEKELLQKTLSPLLPAREEALYFYGLHPDVYVECKPWLLKDEQKQLIFLEDEGGVILSLLKHPLAKEILSHPRVHLRWIQHREEEIEALALEFPFKRVEVLIHPSKENKESFKLELLKKTALSYAFFIDRRHGYQPFSNFVKNAQQIHRSFYVNRLRNAFSQVPAIVCGAGPSLEKSLGTLRKLENKALIIAGGSTLAALSSKGILPHFGVATDPNLEEYRRFKNSFAFEVPLIYSTRVHPGIFQTSNGPFGYMRSGTGGLLELWMEEELGLQEPFLTEDLSSDTVSVTAISVAFAHFLGCSPILLDGMDMAYTGGVRYSSGVDDQKPLAFEKIDQEKSAADRILERQDIHQKPVYTAVRWLMESSSISHFAKEHPETRFVNVTAGGIGFEGMENFSLEKICSSFEERALKEEVFEKIRQSFFPKDTEEKIQQLLHQLKESLHRLIGHLRILADPRGVFKAIEEIEMEEEIAFLYLFYDVKTILKSSDNFYQEWLELALKYEKIFTQILSSS